MINFVRHWLIFLCKLRFFLMIFLCKLRFFLMILWLIEIEKEQHLFEIEIGNTLFV